MVSSAWRQLAARYVLGLGVVLALQGLGGCAAPPPATLPPGTLTIGEVMHVLTSELVAAGAIAPGVPQAQLRQTLAARGLSDDDVRHGRVFVVRTMFYWNNTASGIKHDVLELEGAPPGLDVRPGQVVEMRVEPQGVSIARVRAPSLAEGGCFYADVSVGLAVEALGALSMVGPRGAASLYCQGIEREGWVRPRTFWHKPPGTLPVPPENFVSPRPVEPAALPEPEPSLAARGLARVTLYLSRSRFMFLQDMPVHVDGERVASLASGQCTVMLLAEGAHRVVAGREGGSLISQRAHKVLDVEVRAGEALVLEYLVNDRVLGELSLGSLTHSDAWVERAYTFAQRAATPADTCALREPARVVGRRTPTGAAR